MQIFLTSTGCIEFIKVLQKHDIGRFFTLKVPTKLYENEKWGFDNGAYIFYKNKEKFDEVKYLNVIETILARNLPPPYLATIPDIVAGGKKSFDFSMKWVERLENIPWNWYFVAQDNMDLSEVDDILSYGCIKGLFLGGSDKFKLQAEYYSNKAKQQGKLFHYGRCGTKNKLFHAYRVGADSVDSTTPIYERQKFYKFITWVQQIKDQQIPRGLFEL